MISQSKAHRRKPWADETTSIKIRHLYKGMDLRRGSDSYGIVADRHVDIRLKYHPSLSSIQIRYKWNDMPDRYTNRLTVKRTECHFGGFRLWFECELCQKRVGVLYIPNKGGLIACRKCLDLRYRSQCTTYMMRKHGAYFMDRELEEQLQKIKRKVYHGKITKKFSTYLRRSMAFENAIAEAI